VKAEGPSDLARCLLRHCSRENIMKCSLQFPAILRLVLGFVTQLLRYTQPHFSAVFCVVLWQFVFRLLIGLFAFF